MTGDKGAAGNAARRTIAFAAVVPACRVPACLIPACLLPACLAAATLAAVCLAPPAAAQAGRIAHAVAAGPLELILARLAAESGRQILFDPRLLAGRRGAATPRGVPLARALDRALADTGLRAREVAPDVLVIEVAAHDRGAAPAPAPDIVVTALRRPTLLGQTSLSIGVLPGATLPDRRVHDLRTLARQRPDLVAVNTGPLQRRLAVRGVSGTGESTVGTYFGETPVTAPSGTGFDAAAIAPDIDLIDIERIELLRGPQGTLYGAGSMGGTLRTLFNRADPQRTAGQVDVEGAVTAHGAPGGAFAAVVNLPVVAGRLAVRVAIGRRHDGGVIDNARLGLKDTDDVTRASERLSLAWVPGDELRLDIVWLSQRNRVGDAAVAYAADGRLRADRSVRAPNRERLTLGSATLHWNPPGVRLVATASHYDWTIVKQLDFTDVIAAQRGNAAACARYAAGIGAAACDAPTRAAYVALLDTRLPAALYQPMAVASTSGEWRISDDGGGAWGWTAGVFAEHRRDDVRSYAVRADAATGRVAIPLDVTGLRLIDTQLDQQAAFAEVRRALGPRVAATLGGRLYRYRRTAGGSTPLPNLFTGTAATPAGRLRTTASGSNLKAELAWTPRDGLLVYALASEGFRPGGVNITPELSAAERAYRADHLWSYELGAKAPRLLGPFNAELSVYHIDWSDTIFATNSANGAFVYNTNLSSVAIDGGEVQLGWTARRWRMQLSAALVDARLAADTLAGTSDGVGHKGDRLPNLPRVTWAATWDWTVTETDRAAVLVGGTLTANGSSDSTFSAANPYHERTPARALLDLYLSARRGDWTARLGVDNLTDALAPGRIVSSGFGLGQVYAARPRTVTLGVTRTF